MLNLIVCALVLATVSPAPITEHYVREFDVELYKSVAKNVQPGANVAVSPFSAETALVLAFSGAAGQTRSEIESVLGDTADKDVAQTLKSFNASAGGYTIQVANGVFVEKRFEILAAFRNKVISGFGASISSVDFKSQAEAGRTKINAFVEANTNNKIHDLLAEGSLGSSTKLVLVNAIYFKADWVNKFEPGFTSDQPFFLLDGTSKTVRMMSNTDFFGYGECAELGGAQLLDLAYTSAGIMSKKETGLKGLEDLLTATALDAAFRSLTEPQRVEVSLPKFRVNSGFDLTDTLKLMGMSNAFSDSADFSGITNRRNLTISKVVQKVFVGVDEQGTEAAAATAVSMTEADSAVMFSVPPPVFRADRPFLYLVRHNTKRAVLFMGRVADPTVEE